MIDPKDCVVDLLCTRDKPPNAARVRHLPSGISVTRVFGNDPLDLHLPVIYSQLRSMLQAKEQGLTPAVVPIDAPRPAELWPNQPSHDWIIQRSHRTIIEITIPLTRPKPTLEELRTLRRWLPQFQSESPSNLRNRLVDSSNIVVGQLSHHEAEQLLKGMRDGGIEAELNQCVETTWLPVDRTTGTAWLIERDEDLQKVVEQMIANGVSVVDVEID